MIRQALASLILVATAWALRRPAPGQVYRGTPVHPAPDGKHVRCRSCGSVVLTEFALRVAGDPLCAWCCRAR